MQCPKCATEQTPSLQCRGCGIYFEKYARYLQRKRPRKARIADLRSKNYPFFFVHMLMFGGSGFLMAYADNAPPLPFLYAHGGFAILAYTAFYVKAFGRDSVKWMFINGALGLLGIYSQIGWILDLFGRDVTDYPAKVHVIPFLYFILYTFLLRQAAIDLTNARANPKKKRRVEVGYVAISSAVYLLALAF